MGHSDVYKWGLLKGDPEVSDTKYHADVWSLADRLTAAGWEPAGRGRSWYELRFVWRREDAPPERARSCARGGRPMTARVTRAGFLWAGAAAAGGATVALRGGDGASHAAPSKSSDREILAFFLTLEQVQEAFYRQAVESGGLDGELLELASRVGTQEREHAAFLTQRLGADGARAAHPGLRLCLRIPRPLPRERRRPRGGRTGGVTSARPAISAARRWPRLRR